MDGLDTALDDYRRKRETFVWDVPKSFNFARDVVDRFAAEPGRPATLYRDAHGADSSITFGQMSEWVHRFAGVLDGLGVGCRERVMFIPAMVTPPSAALYTVPCPRKYDISDAWPGVEHDSP